jgi:hypothetical protein
MTRLAKLFNARRLVQGAATVLTVTLALTVRVEHSCSDKPRSYVSPTPAILYVLNRLKAADDPFR